MPSESIRLPYKKKQLQRRHIAALVAVGDSLSVHAAAREIGMSQPALSRLLAEAEELLATRLFDRSSFGCTPTADGEAVLTQARLVMRGLDELGCVISNARPKVRLGCIPRSMYTFMPVLLNLIYPNGQVEDEKHDLALPPQPSFELNVVEGNSTQLFDGLRHGKFDFVIVRCASSAPRTEPSITIERLYDDKIVIICSSNNNNLSDSRVTLRELSSQDWLLPDTNTTSRQAFDSFFEEHGLPPIKPIMEVRSFEANLALVAGTRFLSIAPESIAKQYSSMGLKIVRIRPDLSSSPVMLAHHTSQLQSVGLKKFRDLLKNAARRLKC